MLVDQRKLDLYVNKNFNVLFEGERGVGKTSIIFSTFEKAGMRVKYFSAPTMDPWTDLVGVPTTVTRNDGKEVLRLVPPEDFADDKYDVIFIDELNRAPKKVMNALMELIQFKTINGKPYNIKMIWAAINPHTEDEDYHVEPLDPAVRDRFQIQIKFPYKADVEFFKKNYGSVGEIFCNWWANQPAAVQKEVSPRRLYDTTGFYIDGGDIEDMINVGNIAKLKEELKGANQLVSLEKDFNEKNLSPTSRAILNKNYTPVVDKYLKGSATTFQFFLPAIDKEWIAKEFLGKDKIYNYLMKATTTKDEERVEIAKTIITGIVNTNPGKNPFVRRNFDELKEFLTDVSKAEYDNLANLQLSSLFTSNQQEANFVRRIGEYRLITKSSKITGSDLLELNWSNVRSMTAEGLKAVNAGHMDIDRCKRHIGERLGMLFALVTAQGQVNDSMKKTIESLTNSKAKSFIWNKNNIDTVFSDVPDMILNTMEKYAGFTENEIRDEYLNIVKKPRENNSVKPRKPR